MPTPCDKSLSNPPERTSTVADPEACWRAMPCAGPPGYDYACGGQCSNNNVCCYTAERTFAPCPGGEHCTNNYDTGYDVCCAFLSLLVILTTLVVPCLTPELRHVLTFSQR